MHELSIAEDILKIVSPRIGAQHSLSAVHLTLGPLSGVSTESLRFCFPEVAEMHGFGRPSLIVDELPAQMHCLDCGCEYALRRFSDGCPGCGSLLRDVRSGSEFMIDWIEVRDT